MSGQPPRGFGFNMSIMGELKNRQKATGRYVEQNVGKHESTGEDTDDTNHLEDAPPLPKRPSKMSVTAAEASVSSRSLRSVSGLSEDSIPDDARSLHSTDSIVRNPSPQPPPLPPTHEDVTENDTTAAENQMNVSESIPAPPPLPPKAPGSSRGFAPPEVDHQQDMVAPPPPVPEEPEVVPDDLPPPPAVPPPVPPPVPPSLPPPVQPVDETTALPPKVEKMTNQPKVTPPPPPVPEPVAQVAPPPPVPESVAQVAPPPPAPEPVAQVAPPPPVPEPIAQVAPPPPMPEPVTQVVPPPPTQVHETPRPETPPPDDELSQQLASIDAAAKKRREEDQQAKKEAFQEWEIYKNAEGEEYYVNRKTGETTWDKPMVLMTDLETQSLSGEFVWVKHPILAWVPCRIVQRLPNGKMFVEERPQSVNATIRSTLESRRQVSEQDLGPAIPIPQVLHSLTSDLVQLDDVHEPGIIDLLRRRYAGDKIYTNVGDILVAVNPFKATNLFTPAIMQEYAQTGKLAMDLPPHPYMVINGAYRDMIQDGVDQSILISGESGAGKTVTVKVCLEFLSEIAGSDDNIEHKILAANPILEAFGNAKTVRNDNSSRFGKFMELHFSCGHKHEIKGCHTINYLLEKSRVVAQAPGERNFHIFHYLLGEFSEKQKAAYMITHDECYYNYVSADGARCASPDQHNDTQECSKMFQALEEIGFSEEETDSMMKAVSAILHLGNIDFEPFESTGSKICEDAKSQEGLNTFCALTKTDVTKVSDALTKMVSMQRDGVLTRAFRPQMAVDTRNALARHMYSRMFEWIVGRINATLAKGLAVRKRSTRTLSVDAAATRFIGMLDIFGFEIFETNSFEQLCINFANEKLQQMFNRHTFTLEEETYLREGVPFEKISFHDSQPLLSFLGLAGTGEAAVRDGVFQLLDEQTAINGTDEKFLLAVSSRHRSKTTLFSDRVKSRTAFKVFHYAGDVEYETGGFVVKNADKLFDNVESAMAESGVDLIATLFNISSDETRTGRKAVKTQASTFIRQLIQLEERTNATFPRYVRCVKPNQKKMPHEFDSVSCLEQLRFAGVFEAVSIRKRGYPFRRTHEQFYYMYRCMAPHATTKDQLLEARKMGAFQTVARKVLDAIIAGPLEDAKLCHFGKSMVLYRAEQHRRLELCRLSALNLNAATIQKRVRGMYIRNRIPELRRVRDSLRDAIRKRNSSELQSVLHTSETMFFKVKEAYDAEVVLEILKLEATLSPKISDLCNRSAPSRGQARFESSLQEEIGSICNNLANYMKRDPLAFADTPDARLLVARHELFERQINAVEGFQKLLDTVDQHGNAENMQRIGNFNEALDTDLKNLNSKANEAGDVLLQALTERRVASFKCLEELKTEAKTIQNISNLARACKLEGVKGNLNVNNIRSGIESLEAAIQQGEIVVRSLDVNHAMNNVQLMDKLYRSLVTALETAEHAHDPEWKLVERFIGEGQTLALSPANDFYVIPEDELRLMVAELTLRAQVDEVVARLQEAVAAVDDGPLATLLQQAEALDLKNHHEPTVRELVQTAEVLLPQIQDCRRKLATGISSVSEAALLEALQAQTICCFGDVQGMVGSEIVAEARQLYTWVVILSRNAERASVALEMSPAQIVVSGCDAIRLDIPQLLGLREFLHLPRDRQTLRQRDAATQLQNYPRAIAMSIAYKDTVFASQEAQVNFALEHFPKLKSPADFAKRFGITFNRYKGNMLHWYNPMFGKIHTSLTTIEPTAGLDHHGIPIHKTATTLFKNVFGVMGDKIYENVDALACEILETGVLTPLLRDEIYCQVMKQLTENPKSESESRGWNLMAMLLASFPPSQVLENYLELFLRNRGKKYCVHLLHASMLCGTLATPPTFEEVSQARNVNGSMGVWFEGPREILQLSKASIDAPVQPDQESFDWQTASFKADMLTNPHVPVKASADASPSKTMPTKTPSMYPSVDEMDASYYHHPNPPPAVPHQSEPSSPPKASPPAPPPTTREQALSNASEIVHPPAPASTHVENHQEQQHPPPPPPPKRAVMKPSGDSSTAILADRDGPPPPLPTRDPSRRAQSNVEPPPVTRPHLPPPPIPPIPAIASSQDDEDDDDDAIL